MAITRRFDHERDTDAVYRLIIELQDFERERDSGLPSGGEIVELYFQWMMARCRQHGGRLYVGEEDGRVAGFVTVLSKDLPIEPDEYPVPYAMITELIVERRYRGRGLGKLLLEHAEDSPAGREHPASG
ncbi:MAG: GNAT family N-acetyltransferase [Chloroflexi bacterium]|nr:GNAT family N-acetyltransferase [Chloroflexota bacterium]